MANWCFGDDALATRVARAWPIETLADMIGKPPAAIKARHPQAGNPLKVTAGLVETIKVLLPGRRLAAVAAVLDMTPEEVAAICRDFDLLADYDESSNHRHQSRFVEADRHTIMRMRAAGVPFAGIARALSRSEESVKREAKRINDGTTAAGIGVADNREWRPGWSQEEEQTLRDMYGRHTSTEIAATLGRSVKAVRRKIETLALTKSEIA